MHEKLFAVAVVSVIPYEIEDVSRILFLQHCVQYRD